MHNLLGERSPEQYLDDYLRSSLEQRYKLSLSNKLGASNSFVILVRKDFADKHRLRNLSSLQLLIAQNPNLNLRVAFKPSFIVRADGYAQLRKVYGFDFKNLSAMEYNIAYQQLKAGRIDIIDAFSTDARLNDTELKVLADDRHALLDYDSVYVIRQELLKQQPQLAELLSKLNNSLSNDEMLKLNAKVSSGESYSSVAQEFLRMHNVILNAVKDPSRDRMNEDLAFLLRALKQHIVLSLTALLIAILLGLLIGVYISRNDNAAKLILGIASVTQVIPSLALLALLIPILGLGFKPALAALSIYALLPIIQNTYSGIRSIAPEYIDLAHSLALNEWTIITKVQLAMAAPSIIAGIRTSSVICIGAATLATFVGAGGLGDIIKAGIDLNSNYLIALGALPAALLALLISYSLSVLEKRFL